MGRVFCSVLAAFLGFLRPFPLVCVYMRKGCLFEMRVQIVTGALTVHQNHGSHSAHELLLSDALTSYGYTHLVAPSCDNEWCCMLPRGHHSRRSRLMSMSRTIRTAWCVNCLRTWTCSPWYLRLFALEYGSKTVRSDVCVVRETEVYTRKLVAFHTRLSWPWLRIQEKNSTNT